MNPLIIRLASRRILPSTPVTRVSSSAVAQRPPRTKHAKMSTAPQFNPISSPRSPPPLISRSLSIAGNASHETKRVCLDGFATIVGAQDRDGFAHAVGKRVRLTQVDVTPRTEEPIRREARVVCEVIVESDMVNVIGTLHGGCSAFLVDDCSSLPILVLGHELYSRPIHGVTQTLSMCYHAPAFLGARLRIVSTSLTFGNRIMSSRCEIWDATNQRLVVSGVHTKMQPSS